MDAIGILTAGGDCPGLNAVVRGVVVRAARHGIETVGILNGWDGLMPGSSWVPSNVIRLASNSAGSTELSAV